MDIERPYLLSMRIGEIGLCVVVLLFALPNLHGDDTVYLQPWAAAAAVFHC